MAERIVSGKEWCARAEAAEAQNRALREVLEDSLVTWRYGTSGKQGWWVTNPFTDKEQQAVGDCAACQALAWARSVLT